MIDRTLMICGFLSLIGIVILLVVTQLWMGILVLLLCGGAFAHQLLLKAGHRLNAFDLILPLSGLVLGIIILISLLGTILLGKQLLSVSEQLELLVRSLFLMAALLVWCAPLLLQKKAAPTLLGIVCVLLLISESTGLHLLLQS
ncbi:hypothetical protein [Dongshaea marina]|uniref:hypothetical protein n=1 Tax=Dongshaea marina TaxID=2047966 RepID=UPI00131F0C31|nr:hypothetical protein [Dongshaea marina]